MSTVQGGSQIANGRLLLSIDFGTRNSYAPNLLNHSNWIAGSGSISADASLTGSTGYTMVGTASENIRSYETDPYGYSTVVWTSPANDLDTSPTGDPDGGFATSNFDIDSKKMYRFSIWIKRSASDPATRGYVYLGMRGTGGNSYGGNTQPISLRLNGSTNSNPYFYFSRSSTHPPQSNAGEWTLLVGHIWPYGSGTGSNHPDTGAWTIAGGQTYSNAASSWTDVNNFRDMSWLSNINSAGHRTFLYYSTDATENVKFAYPRVDIIDGREPSIAELLVGPDIIRDLSKESKTMVPTLANSSNWRSNKVGSFGFSGTMSFLDPATTALGASNSIDIWFKRRASINSLNILFSRQLPYFAFRSDGNFQYSNRINLSQAIVSSSATYTNGIWYNAVCTTDYASAINVSTMRIYVDGGLEGSGTFSGSQTNYGTSMDRIMIGAHLNGLITGSQYYYHFDGDIGEVRVYDRSLTAEEILAGYNKRKNRYK
mgnify:CR=1 FL=1|jgi:hypothetical protein